MSAIKQEPCPKCGQNNPLDHVICDFCGAQLPWAEQALAHAPVQPKRGHHPAPHPAPHAHPHPPQPHPPGPSASATARAAATPATTGAAEEGDVLAGVEAVAPARRQTSSLLIYGAGIVTAVVFACFLFATLFRKPPVDVDIGQLTSMDDKAVLIRLDAVVRHNPGHNVFIVHWKGGGDEKSVGRMAYNRKAGTLEYATGDGTVYTFTHVTDEAIASTVQKNAGLGALTQFDAEDTSPVKFPTPTPTPKPTPKPTATAMPTLTPPP